MTEAVAVMLWTRGRPKKVTEILALILCGCGVNIRGWPLEFLLWETEKYPAFQLLSAAFFCYLALITLWYSTSKNTHLFHLWVFVDLHHSSPAKNLFLNKHKSLSPSLCPRYIPFIFLVLLELYHGHIPLFSVLWTHSLCNINASYLKLRYTV